MINRVMMMRTKYALSMLLLMVFSGQSMATDLMFKTGFENRFLVAGTVTGLDATSLVLELHSVSGIEHLTVQQNGPFAFELLVMAGHAWRVEMVTVPNNPQQQSCQLSNSSGNALPVGGVDDVLVECQNQPWHWDVMNWDQGGWN